LKQGKQKMKKFKIIRDAERQIRSCFLGIAVPHQPSLADGEYGPIRSEKVIKFNKTALRNMGKMKKEKVDPTHPNLQNDQVIRLRFCDYRNYLRLQRTE
jgi:hypothetical protein